MDETNSPPPVADAIGMIVRRLMMRGKQRLDQAATSGRLRLEIRQAQKDRDQFWIRLGRTAYSLVQEGEVDHPALRKAMQRIDELESRIKELEAAPTDE
jgi:hypothetical protein